MSDDDAENEEPLVELGSATPVEGAPLARIVARLSWPQEKSAIQGKIGDEIIRTPSGPQNIGSILDRVDITYFARRQEFIEAIENQIGSGPIPTEE